MECPVDDQGCLGDQTEECLKFCSAVGSRPHRTGEALRIGGPHISPTRAPRRTALRDTDEPEPERDPLKL